MWACLHLKSACPCHFSPTLLLKTQLLGLPPKPLQETFSADKEDETFK